MGTPEGRSQKQLSGDPTFPPLCTLDKVVPLLLPHNITRHCDINKICNVYDMDLLAVDRLSAFFG